MTHSARDVRRSWRWAWLLVLVTAGCQQTETPPASDSGSEVDSSGNTVGETARQILDKLSAAYREADHYQDRGELGLQYKLQGSLQKISRPLVTRWSRPGRLYLHNDQLEVACLDGHLRARMHDQATADLDGQVLFMPTAEKLSIEHLLSDPLLKETLLSGQVGIPLPILLLLDQAGLAAADEIDRLEDRQLGEKACYRLQIRSADGTMVVWIDSQQMIVLKQEITDSPFTRELKNEPGVRDVSLQVDFHHAAFEESPGESSYLIEEPEPVRIVGHFVFPPAPLPTDLYGRRPGRFELVTSADNVVDRDSLRGRITVLLWCQANESCQSVVSRLAKITAGWSSQEDLQVFAVFVDPVKTSAETIADWLKESQASVPFLRDLDGLAGETLQIDYAPTLVVLNAEGTLQVFLPAVTVEQVGQLEEVVGQLRGGTDLAAAVGKQQLLRQEEYERKLIEAEQLAAANLGVAEMAQPGRFVAEPVWTFTAASAAGNMLLLPSKQHDFDLLLIDDGKQVIHVDPEGKSLATYQLPVADNGTFSMLRSATDRDGNRFYAIMSPGSQQVIVLDDSWKQIMAYPEAAQRHDGISQVVLTDLEDDGQVELYVAFWGLAGVHRVNLKGERQWGFRGVSDVISLVASPRNEVGWQKLLITDQSGQLIQLNQYGNADPAIDTDSVPLHHLFVGNLEETAMTRWCAISSTRAQMAVGLDLELRTRWQFPVSLGTFATAVEMVSSLQFSPQDGGIWLIAVANGAVHMVAHDGSFADKLAVGERITGITAGRFGDDSLVFIATGKKLTCWKITPRN